MLCNKYFRHEKYISKMDAPFEWGIQESKLYVINTRVI